MSPDGDDWRTDAEPLGVFGTTGAGKTTLLRCLHFTFDGEASIFFNSDEEPAMGEVVRSPSELNAALERGDHVIDYRINEMEHSDPDEYEKVIQYLMMLGNDLRRDQSIDTPAVQFITDECHEYDEAGLITAAKRFRKRKIKPVMSTQEPPSVSPRARSVNSWYAWLSPPPKPMHSWIKQQSNFDLDLLIQLPEYDALVMDEQHEAIGRYRAPEEYARE